MSDLDFEEEEQQTRGGSKKPAKEKEIVVIQDQGHYKHDTGDTYDGFFEAKKKDRSVKMHGPGIYTTAEKDTYTGVWDSNTLSAAEDVTICYNTDGSRYDGRVKDFTYIGKATYTYPNGCTLEANFADNCPVGNLLLRDPNGHYWTGKAHQGYAWLDPENHYYGMLEPGPPPPPPPQPKLKSAKLSKSK